MAYTSSFALDIGTPGLTLKWALTSAGTIHATLRDQTSTFYADAAGGYEAVLTTIPDGFRGMVVFYTGTIGVATDFSGVTTYSRGSINPEEIENTDIKTSAAGGGLDAAGTRAALGLASANLDTQLGDVPTANENADALLARNVAGGSSSGRTVKESLAFLRNKWAVVGTTLTVYGVDDVTPLWTATITPTAGADPITASDPV